MTSHLEKENSLKHLRKGELVLVAPTSRKKGLRAAIGLFEKLRTEARATAQNPRRGRLLLEAPTYSLQPGVKVGKGAMIPKVSVRAYTSFDLANIERLYRGKDEIVQYLKQDEELRVHNKWISRLEGPEFEFPSPTMVML